MNTRKNVLKLICGVIFGLAAAGQSAAPIPVQGTVPSAGGNRPNGGSLPPANTDLRYQSWAPTPPMGWNSWDSFGAGIWQDDVLANIDYMDKNLRAAWMDAHHGRHPMV